MSVYTVEGPDGHQYDIEGPDGASNDEVIAQAQKLFGQSGGMAPVHSQNALQVLRNAVSGILNGPQIHTSPKDGYNQDRYGPGIQDATVGDAANIYSLYKSPEAIAGLYNLGKAGVATGGNAVNYLKGLASAPSAAEALAPAEDAISAGTTAGTSRVNQLSTIKGAVSDAYAKVPQDLQVATPQVQSAADDVIAAQKKLPQSFRSSKINKIAGDLQNIDSTDLGTLRDMRSHLADMAYNGDGTEKLYAGKLLGALDSDLSAFGGQSPIKQAGSLAEGDLRKLWVNNAGQTLQPGMEEAQNAAHFQNPANVAPLTNADVPQNLSSANSLYSSMQDVLQHPTAQALAKARPEEMTGVIFRPKATLEDLGVARATLGPVGFNSVQGQFYRQLVNAKDIGATMSKYSPEFLQASLGPTKVAALQKLAQFNAMVAKAKAAAMLAGGAAGVGGAISVGKKLF